MWQVSGGGWYQLATAMLGAAMRVQGVLAGRSYAAEPLEYVM